MLIYFGTLLAEVYGFFAIVGDLNNFYYVIFYKLKDVNAFGECFVGDLDLPSGSLYGIVYNFFVG